MPSRKLRLSKDQAQRYQRLLGLVRVRREHYGESKPDGVSPRFVAEYKARKTLPKFLTKAYGQARSYLGPKDGRIAILILHEVGRRWEHDLVVLSLRDFRRLVEGQGGQA